MPASPEFRNPALRAQVALYATGPSFMGVLLGAGIVLAFVVCYFMFPAEPAIAWSILTIAAPGAVAWQRFRRNGLLDCLGLFCFSFLAYNGVLLLRLATMADPTATIYPWPFTQETYAQAGVFDAIAAVTILVTATLAARVFPRPIHSRRDRPIPDGGSEWLYASLFMYIIGLIMYFLQFQQFGGYFASIQMGRGIYVEHYESAYLSWPYVAFVVPGLAGLWYSSGGKDGPAGGRWISWGALILWCGLAVVQGIRLLVIQAVLTVLAVTFAKKRRALTLDIRFAALLLVAYAGLAIFAYLRTLIPPLIGGEMTTAEAEVAVENTSLLDTLKPERMELAGQYLSLLEVASKANSIPAVISYFEALPAVLPRALYPGTKPAYLSERFSVSVSRSNGPASGWGFNPVAEASMNFGIGGIVVVFMLWTLAFYGLDSIKERAPLGTLASSVLIFEAIDVNRIDFRNVYGIAVYFTFGIMLMLILSKLFAKMGSPTRLTERPLIIKPRHS